MQIIVYWRITTFSHLPFAIQSILHFFLQNQFCTKMIYDCSVQSILTLGPLTFRDRFFVGGGAVLCIVACLPVCSVSPHQMPVAQSKVSPHLQMPSSLGGWGAKSPFMKTLIWYIDLGWKYFQIIYLKVSVGKLPLTLFLCFFYTQVMNASYSVLQGGGFQGLVHSDRGSRDIS